MMQTDWPSAIAEFETAVAALGRAEEDDLDAVSRVDTAIAALAETEAPPDEQARKDAILKRFGAPDL